MSKLSKIIERMASGETTERDAEYVMGYIDAQNYLLMNKMAVRHQTIPYSINNSDLERKIMRALYPR